MTASAHARSAGSHEPAFSGLPLYALIDPYFGEPAFISAGSNNEHDAPRSLAELAAKREQAWDRAVAIDESTEPRLPTTRLPYIVALVGAADAWVPEILAAVARQHREAIATSMTRIAVGAFIESDLEAQDVMARVSLMSRQSADGQPRHLRLVSPRVMELLAHVLSATQLAYWLGPLSRWHHVDRSGRWQCLHAVPTICDDAIGSGANGAPPVEATGRLAATHAQLRALAQSEVVNRALDKMQASGTPFTRARLERALVLSLDLCVAKRGASIEDRAQPVRKPCRTKRMG